MERPLQIPPNKKWKGLTVFCYRCNTNVSDICKQSKKSIKHCRNGDKHFFKVVIGIPGTNQRQTKKLETRDINEAIQQAIDFEREVKSGVQKSSRTQEKNKRVRAESANRPHLLIHALARYIGWLHNEGVPAHLQKERSVEHIKDVERAFRLLVDCLRNNKYDLNRFTVEDINDDMIGKVYEYLLNKKQFGNRSFNKYLSYYTSFLSQHMEAYDVPMRNWFERVKRKKVNTNPEAITQSEFIELLKIITPEKGERNYASGVKRKRQLYRPWLKDGIQLGLFTGRRREEIISLKFSDYVKKTDGTEYIKVEDYKVNRIQNRNDEEKKYIYIPVTHELRDLLLQLGLEEKAGSDSYILAPEIVKYRVKSMSDALSKGFSHYYNQIGTGRKLTFKSLRKTYVTNLSLFMGGNAKAITQHSGDAVIEQHYLDKQALVNAAQRFEVFHREQERKNEIETVRTKSKSPSKSQEIEK